MPSRKVRCMDPFCGLTEIEVYNISSLKSNHNIFFENTNPDISLTQDNEYFKIQFTTENKDTKMSLTNN